MRVLLTGAAGFVGSHVAHVLAREGHEVHAVVRSRTDRLDAVLPPPRIVRCDLTETAEVEQLVGQVRPEVCIHCAWFAVPGQYLHSPENAAHLRAGLELAQMLAASGCRRFIGVGTCLEYAASDRALSEASPTGPVSPYAESKLALYRALEELGRETGIGIAWARLFHLYGPYEDARRLVPSVVLSLLRDKPARTTGGEQIRDFLHADDVARAISALGASNVVGAVNVASSQPVRVRDLVQRIGEIVGRPELIELGAAPYPHGERMAIVADNTRLVAECGWAPRLTLDNGLQETVKWWKSRSRA